MNAASDTDSRQRSKQQLRRAGAQLDRARRDRVRAIVSAKRAGLSIRQIAEVSSLSPSRVHQLLNTAEQQRLPPVATPAPRRYRETLRHSALFAALDDDAIDLLARRVVAKTLPERAVLIFESDASDGMYLIVSGEVDVYADEPNGREVLLNVLGAGDCLGELAMLDGKPRSASARTRTECRVLSLSRADFIDTLTDCPGVALDLLAVLAARMRSQTEQTKSLALKTAYQRLVAAFDDLGDRSADGRRVLSGVTHQRLADHIHVSREMVTRLLKDLKEGGYIETGRRQITLKKPLPAYW